MSVHCLTAPPTPRRSCGAAALRCSQAMAAVLGGTQSLHTNSFDEVRLAGREPLQPETSL